ncbi:MAG: allantoinase AllB [Candidatus Acidiferrales bacterium]
MKLDLIIRGERVVTPQGVRRAALHIRRGSIAAVTGWESAPEGCPLFDAGQSVVMAGLIDSHVHINEPGRTSWEGFSSATRAAAAGGVTTLIDMPLNSIPATTTLAALKAKRRAARGRCWVDVGFWGGVVPGNVAALRSLHEAGVFGFKCFLVPSGVPEFAHVEERDLRAALPVLAHLDSPLLAHAELPGPIEAVSARVDRQNPKRYQTWLASRPPESECDAIALLIRLSREFHARVHIVHLSASAALPSLRRARRVRYPVSVETCPHYLFFASETIRDSAVSFKCAPPIRDATNRDRLWRALARNEIDFIVSDHSPCPPEMKTGSRGNFFRAWGGIASLELRLPIVWTEARRRGHSLEQVARWLSEGPARLLGLQDRKGTLVAGADADLVVWNPEKMFRLKPAQLHQRHKITPYAGQALTGVVQATFLKGRRIFADGKFFERPAGSLLERETR